MSKKKSELKSSVKQLRAQLAKSEARAERWKARAKAAEAGSGTTSTEAGTDAGPAPEQRIGQAVTETLRVLTTTLDDVVTSARAAFDDLAAGKRSDSSAVDSPAPPTTRPAWPPAANPFRAAPEPDAEDPSESRSGDGLYDDPRG